VAAGFLFIAGAVFFWTGTGIFYRKAGSDGLTLLPLGFLVSALGTAGSFFFTGLDPELFSMLITAVPFILVMAAAGIINQAAMLAASRSMSLGPSSPAWAILQSSMVVPFVYSLLFWGERAGASQIIGLPLMLAAVVLLSGWSVDTRKTARSNHTYSAGYSRWLLMVALAFVLNGVQQIFFLIPSHEPAWREVYSARVFIGQAGSTLFFLVLFLFSRQKITKGHIRVALPLTCCVIFGQLVFLLGADILAEGGLSGIAFPFVVVGIILVFTIYSRFILKDTVTIKQWIGVGIGALGILFLSLP
jgi:drug/metabolite transporter (DMT)-like permease